MSDSFATDSLGQLKVLVVDDHPVNREFLRAGLTELVGQLDLVDSGEAAIERCGSQAYHVILMDLHMPNLDGLATAHRIRDLGGPAAEARMIVMTADARPEERARLLENGFDAYLSKPMSIPQIATTLRRILELGPAAALRPDPSDFSGTEPLLDLARARVATHGDDDSVARLGLMLGQELAEKLPLLDQWLLSGDKDRVAELLHQWTGAGGFAGATRFSRTCSTLRRSLQDQPSSSTGTAYADFLRTAWAACQALKIQGANQTLD